MVVVMDLEAERSAEKILDNCSQPSYLEEEQLSGTLNVSLPSRKRPWMDTRLRTRMQAGGSRLHYQQFDYSTSGQERALSEDLMSDAPDHFEAEPPALVEASMPPNEQHLSPELTNNHELPLFSEPEMVPELSQTEDVPTTTAEAEVSLAGTSAPLSTNP